MLGELKGVQELPPHVLVLSKVDVRGRAAARGKCERTIQETQAIIVCLVKIYLCICSSVIEEDRRHTDGDTIDHDNRSKGSTTGRGTS